MDKKNLRFVTGRRKYERPIVRRQDCTLGTSVVSSRDAHLHKLYKTLEDMIGAKDDEAGI